MFKDALEGGLASQPILSRFENSVGKQTVYSLCYGWINRYVGSLKDRKSVTIYIDATDASTYGEQQLSMFYELFFYDGDTGQIIVPVLQLGNSHSNKWY